MRQAATLHASCVVVGEAGVLIRGASGSGKSRLARRLVSASPGFARLVCDDRVQVEATNGRLVARAVPAIAGMVEIRGLGLMPIASEPAAVVRLVVDGVSKPAQRLPGESDAAVDILGVTLPRVAGRLEEIVEEVLWRVHAV